MAEKIMVRSIGGEIGFAWIHARRNEPLLQPLDSKAVTRLLDIAVAVMARHEGKMLIPDDEIPVEPLPRQEA